jgi:hypothetical protein
MLSMTPPGLALGHDFKPERDSNMAATAGRQCGRVGKSLCVSTPVARATFHRRPRQETNSGRTARTKDRTEVSPQQTVKAVEAGGL